MGLIDKSIPLTAPEQAWLIHLQGETTYANALTSEVPQQTRGVSGNYPFVFYTRTTSDIGFDPVLTQPDPEDEDEYLDRAEAVYEPIEHAGSFVLHRSARNRYRITPQTPPEAPSLIVGLEPVYDTIATDGVWGAIGGYEADARLEEELVFVTLEVTMLAPFDDYDSWGAASAALAL